MAKKLEILEKKEVYKKAIFRIVEARLRHERYDGSMSPTMSRLSLERGDAIAAIMYHPDEDTIVLVEQFRFPTQEKTGDGWFVEVPAGMINEGEEPIETAKREIEEETGYRVESLKQIAKFFLSPGGSSERIFLFFSRINPQQQVGKGGGVTRENEDIRTIHIKVDDALKMLEEQTIEDAKSIIAFQWLALNRSRLKDL